MSRAASVRRSSGSDWSLSLSQAGGSAAYLTVVQSRITSVVIMAGMTDNHRMVVPLLGCALLAVWISKLIQPTGIYHGLSANVAGPKS